MIVAIGSAGSDRRDVKADVTLSLNPEDAQTGAVVLQDPEAFFENVNLTNLWGKIENIQLNIETWGHQAQDYLRLYRYVSCREPVSIEMFLRKIGVTGVRVNPHLQFNPMSDRVLSIKDLVPTELNTHGKMLIALQELLK